MSGVGFILLSLTHSYIYFLLVFVGLLSVAYRAGYNNASIPAVTRWFRRKRSLAISIVLSGQGIGGALITPLVGLMVFEFGWHASALISGVVILAVVPPLALLVRTSPESMGMLPDGLPSDEQQPLPITRHPQTGKERPVGFSGMTAETSADRLYSATDFAVKEAMRTPSYWLFVVTVGLWISVHTGIQWHFVPLMVWSGVGATTAAFFVGVVSFSLLVFNLCAGWMGDKLSKRRICALSSFAGTLALVALMGSGGHLWQLAIFSILLAISQATLPLNWAILGDFFGPSSYAILRGWLQIPMQLMSMMTPVWLGWVFDRTGSYFWALVPLAAIFSLTSLLYWILPRPERPQRLSDTRELGS